MSSPASTIIPCPYPGLRPFGTDEADRFFGRGRQVSDMLAKLEGRRFMAVVGVSGCGKSSLVRAGLIPAIRDGFLSSDAERWRIALMRPGEAPFTRLTVLTPRLTRDQYRDAILEPARLYGGDLDPALVTRLLNDMREDPDQLPVLQHALMRMWTRATADPGWDRRLGIDHYTDPAIGGLAEALSNHCDEVLQDQLDGEQGRIAEQLFRALCERSAQRDTRRPQPLGKIAPVAGRDLPSLLPVVEAFRYRDRSFLTPPPPEPLTSDTVVDISHESLISHWSRLDGWVRAEGESAAL
jgi:energy-coupling factor transporter ATP-binding protein EcfA2